MLGPNGAGKSTLLRGARRAACRSTAGAIASTASVLDDAATGTFVAAEQRPVGLVFQDYLLFPHLSVLDNVAFGPRARGLGRARRPGRAPQWLERLGLADLAEPPARQLSGGQAQRVALARALAAGPGACCCSTSRSPPSTPAPASTCRSELRRHLADFAGPVLVVTHDPLEALVSPTGCSSSSTAGSCRRARRARSRAPGHRLRRPAGRAQPVCRPARPALGRGDPSTAAALVATLTPPDAAFHGRVLVALSPTAISLHVTPPGPHQHAQRLARPGRRFGAPR